MFSTMKAMVPALASLKGWQDDSEELLGGGGNAGADHGAAQAVAHPC